VSICTNTFVVTHGVRRGAVARASCPQDMVAVTPTLRHSSHVSPVLLIISNNLVDGGTNIRLTILHRRPRARAAARMVVI
jgi:hypothetical protein